MNGFNRSAWIHVNNAATQGSKFSLGDQIFFRDQDTVGKADLLLGFFLSVKGFHAVFGIHDSDHRIEAVVVGDVIVHEKCLANWAWVSHAGGFNNDALKIQLAGLTACTQIVERAHQIATYRAAHAAIREFDDFFILLLHKQFVVDALGAKFVFDDRNALAVVFGQDAFEQGRFASTKKAGEDCDGDHFVWIAGGIHEPINFKKRVRVRGTEPSASPKANAGLQHSTRFAANIFNRWRVAVAR